MPKVKDEAGRQRVRSFYEKTPLPDPDIARALQMPRTTVTTYRNQLGLPPVSLCGVCKAPVEFRKKLCDEHRAASRSAAKREKTLGARAIGNHLIELSRVAPERCAEELNALRAQFTPARFQQRFGWALRKIATQGKQPVAPIEFMAPGEVGDHDAAGGHYLSPKQRAAAQALFQRPVRAPAAAPAQAPAAPAAPARPASPFAGLAVLRDRVGKA